MGGNNSAIFGKHHSLTGIDYLTLAALAGTGLGAAGIGPLAGIMGSGASAAGTAAAGGLGGGTASLFGPTAAQASLVGDIGGGSAIPMFTAGEGLGAGGAGLGAFAPAGADASMASLGGSLDATSPSFLAQLQGFMRPGGPLSQGLSNYQKVSGAMNAMGGGQGRSQTAQPVGLPSSGMPVATSSQIFGERTANPMQANSAGMVGNAMGGGMQQADLMALIRLLQQQQQAT